MLLSSFLQATLVLQLFSIAVCQFPQFQFPQMGSPQQMASNGMLSMPPIASLPQLAPQPMFSPPMPISFPMQRKMPSVVMPFYSKSANNPEKKYRRKRRKPRRHDESWESDHDSGSSSSEFDFRRSKTKKRRQVLTPVVSYVTKDGYVVYQKKIKKDRAKEWLEMNKKNKESKEVFTSGEERQFQKMLKYKKKRHQHH